MIGNTPPLQSRRRHLAGWAAAWGAMPAWGQRAPGASGPAPTFPREALLRASVWDSPGFVEPFLGQRRAPALLAHRAWPGAAEVFGLRPHAVTARFRGDPIEALTLLFLDSGTHFGYVPRSQARETEAEHREDFRAHFARVAAAVREGLAGLSGSPGVSAVLGRSPMLEQSVTLYPCGDLTARLHVIEEQLVKATFFREREAALHWMPAALLGLPRRERQAALAASARRSPGGDAILEGIPLLPQGDRAYCGVSALAMAMQSLGLMIDTEDYAAAAGIRYGSTRGSRIREIYAAAAEEAGLRLSRATRFDFRKVRESLESGLPALVWRRWSQERDYFHSAFARKHAADPAATLPEPDAADRAAWPLADAFNHASLVNGFHDQRREVIFSESWNETARDRRMKIEEMEATAYYTFTFRL